MRERYMSRADLEGTGLCRPMGSRGASPVRRAPPMKSYSYNGGISARQRGAVANQGATLASLQNALRKNTTTTTSEKASVSRHSSNGDMSVDSHMEQQMQAARGRRARNQARRDVSRSPNNLGHLTRQTSTTDFLDNSFTSCMQNSHNGLDDKSVFSTSMDVSAATWNPQADRTVANSMDVSAATWGGVGTARTRRSAGLRRTNTGGSTAGIKKSPLKICGPDMRPMPKPASEDSSANVSLGDLFSKLPSMPSMPDVATVVGATSMANVSTDLFGKLPQLRRNKSAPLDAMRASLHREEPMLLSDSEEPPLPVAPPLQRQNSVPLDDLESVEGSEAEDAHATRNINDHKSPLRKPALKRNSSAPMEALQSSLTDDDFFKQFDSNSPLKMGNTMNIGDDGFPAMPPLKRNHSAPTEGFEDFSDLFGFDEPTPDLTPKTKLHVKSENPASATPKPPTRVQNMNEREPEKEVDPGMSLSEVFPSMATAAARRPLRRVKSTPKQAMLAAAQRARAKVQQARDIEGTSLAAKTTLLAAAQRAKARVQERKEIHEVTPPAAKKKLVLAAQRARARVRQRQESDALSVSENSSAVRSRSPSGRRPLGKTKSIPNHCTLDDSFGSGSDTNEEGESEKRRYNKDLSTATWHSGVTDDIDLGESETQAGMRRRDGARVLQRCRSRSPCRLRRANSNSPNTSTRNLNDRKQQHESTLEARRRERKKMLQEQQQADDGDSFAGEDASDQPADLSASVPHDHGQEGEGDYISPTGVNEFQESPQTKKMGRSLSPKARAKMGIKKIRNLMGSPKKERATKEGGTGEAEQTSELDKQSLHEQPKSPMARRSSFAIIRDFVVPKKAFQQMEQVDEGDSSLDLPDLDKMAGVTTDAINQRDDSTAGETSSRSEIVEANTGDKSRSRKEDPRHKQRTSKSRSQPEKLSTSTHQKSTRSAETKPHSEKTSTSVRKKRTSDRARHEKTTTEEKRQSTCRSHAHDANHQKKSSKASEGTGHRDARKAGAGDQRKTSKLAEGISHSEKSSNGRKKRSSKSESKSHRATTTSSQTRRSSKNTDERSKREHAHKKRDMDTSESERSIGLNDLDMTESSHGSLSASAHGLSKSAHGSRGGSDRNNRVRSKASSGSSSRSDGLDDSRSRKAKHQTKSGRERDHESQKRTIDAAVQTAQQQSKTRTSKSLRESLQLDTVLETYSEDDFSEATPRGRKKQVVRDKPKMERSPSASSSIVSTAEVSDSDDDEHADGRKTKIAGRDEFAGRELRQSPAVRGRRSSGEQAERHSLSVDDLRREPFLQDGQSIADKRHHVSDGELIRRGSGTYQFDPHGPDAFYTQQQNSFGRRDTGPHWGESFFSGDGTNFQGPRRDSRSQYPSRPAQYPQEMPGLHGPHPDYYRWHGNMPGMRGHDRFGPFSHHEATQARGFYEDARRFSRNGAGLPNWAQPHGPHHRYDDPIGGMAFNARGVPHRGPGQFHGGDPFYNPRPRMAQQGQGMNSTSHQPREGYVRGGGSMRGVRRRHSIGSGHDRDAIMQEVTIAMEREMKAQTCFRCDRLMAHCECIEPIIDISHHTRDNDSHHGPPHDMALTPPRALGGRLASSDAVQASSFHDTFGINYGDPRAGARMMCRRNDAIDDDMHSGPCPYFHYGPPRPLYGRPENWDVNDYVYVSNSDRLSSSGIRNHRGRAIGRFDGNSDNYGQRGRRSYAVDDGSIRYPRRFSFGGSTSGRTLASEGSGRSFAI